MLKINYRDKIWTEIMHGTFKGAISRFLCFRGCFLCLWKLMLTRLKSLWRIILKISQKTVSVTIDNSATETNFTAQYVYKRKTFHNLFKKDCFPVIFSKFLRMSFLRNTFGRLSLNISKQNLPFAPQLSDMFLG